MLWFNFAEEIGKFMIEKWPEFIKEHDNEGKSPLERASRAGATWLVELILENDRSSIIQAPKAWIEACQGGHLSTVMAFVEKISYFKHLCREHHDTPLHHAKFQHYNKYQKLLAHPIIKDLLNTQDSKGHTPLHKAIRERNMDLAELLINTNEVDWSIRDKYNKDVMDLLKEACHDHEEWDKMCKMNGVNPRLRTTYIHRKTDLTEMRSAISIVAALLATITFTAGFTLPGGLNDEQDHKGEAIMPNKPVFLAFLLADTYAMCCSMLILFCIIWSMVSKRDMTSLLIDWSLELLKQSLYGTLLAFMTGVYVVIYKKSLWTAIVISVMCSLVIILAQRRILYVVVKKLFPGTDTKRRAQRPWFIFPNRRRHTHIQEQEAAAPKKKAVESKPGPSDNGKDKQTVESKTDGSSDQSDELEESDCIVEIKSK